MGSPRKWTVVLVGLGFLGAGIFAGCKQEKDFAGVTVTVTPDFASASVPSNVTDHYVQLQKGVVSSGRITLDVVATEVSEPVSGIALKLTYPKDFSRFIKCTDGDLFPPGKCFFSEPSPGSGEVFIGRSITAPQAPVGVSGSRTIVQIQFLVFGVGAGPITFEAQNLGGGDATALLDANGDPILVKWFAGMISGK